MREVVRRTVAIALGILAGIVLLAIFVVYLLTQTDFGHERVRRIALGKLRAAAHGQVELGGLSGNLLHGATLHELLIADSAGNTLLSADSVKVDYSIGDLLSRRVRLRDVRLVRPLIILDRPPGEDWNFRRIFPGDTTTAPSTGGFGSWVRLKDVTIAGGHMIVKLPFTPADSLPQAARDSVIRAALAGELRWNVAAADHSGYQYIMDFRDVDAELPFVRIADPDSAGMRARVSDMSMIAAIFRPPAADVRHVDGNFTITDDSVYFTDVHTALPASKLTAEGAYAVASGGVRAVVDGDAALEDLRWLYPPLPERGTGSGHVAIHRSGDTTSIAATNGKVRIGSGRASGDVGVTMTDELRFHDTDLRFAGITTGLVEQLRPGLDIPREGTMAGHVVLAGALEEMRIDGDVAFDESGGGRSHVYADGIIGNDSHSWRVEDLRLRLDPLLVSLIETPGQSLPIAGTLTGPLTVNGSTTTGFAARLDLVHRQGSELSRLTGTGRMSLDDSRRVDLDVHAHPLSLATVGRFAPAAELRGTATGDIEAHGPLRNVDFRFDMTVPNAGSLAARGTVDVASVEKGYAIQADAVLFNANAVTARAPVTSLTAHAVASGRGFDPATMDATIAADLARSEVDSLGVDSAVVRVRIAQGLAKVDSLRVRTPFARADIAGAFGLAPGREGELTYDVVVDSLSGFSRWLPTDTGRVEPRPLLYASKLEQARLDSARIAEATLVERAATGYPPEPTLDVDTVMGIARDSIAGSARTQGTIAGNIEHFDLRGSASAEGLVVAGNAVRAASADYAVVDARSVMRSLDVDVTADTVVAAGFALDQLLAKVQFAQADSTGTVDVRVHQDDEREYRVAADFDIQLDRRNVQLNDVLLRFDSTRWVTTHPAGVSWSGSGFEVDDIELVSGADSHIRVDGRLPKTGSADLMVDLKNLRVADIVALLQSDIEATGLLSLNTTITGTQESPAFEGELTLDSTTYAGTVIPASRARFDYANRLLNAHARLVRGSSDLITADARLPVDLAITGVTGKRMLDGPIEVDAVADSLPIDALAALNENVTDARGAAHGSFTVRGTFENPELEGGLVLDNASLYAVPLAIHLNAIAGALSMHRDTVVIDSLVARTEKQGTLRVRGGLGVAKLSEPVFGLELVADNALFMANDYGRVRGNANIALEGPFAAARIGGSVNIIHGVVYVPEPTRKQTLAPEDLARYEVVDTASLPAEVIPTQSPLLANLRADVNVVINRDTWVRSNDANVEVYTPPDLSALAVHIDRASGSFIVEGTVNTDRGQYRFLGRRFELTRGSATFIGTPELDPLVQITAEHDVTLPGREAIAIRILLSGTLREPRIALESDAQPPIPQSDLLSYLAFGRSTSSLLQQQGSGLSGSGTAGGDLVGNVAALATQQLTAVATDVLVDEFQQDAARALGADIFQITPADLLDEFSFTGVGTILKGTEIEIGKYLTPRTFVSVQARPTLIRPGLHFEYRTPSGFRWTTTYEARLLPRDPSLSIAQDPRVTSVFGAFLLKEWRF